MERRWIRPALLVLAVPNLITGLWAVLAPEHWYDTFPGWAPHLVAALPPFNEHLATDAGAGLLCIGALSAYAAYRPRREIVITAMLGVLVFAIPHAVFHLRRPAESMSSVENAVNTGSLVGVAVLAGAILAAAMAEPAPAAAPPTAVAR